MGEAVLVEQMMQLVAMPNTVEAAVLEATTITLVGLAHTAARPYTVVAGAEQACVMVAQ